MKKLIGMTDFVLKQEQVLKIYINHDKGVLFENCTNHAKFLSQPLTLGMFVPAKLVDEVWIVLEEPKCNVCFTGSVGDCHRSKDCGINENPFQEYQEAKSKVIFEDCNLMDGWCLQFSDATLFSNIEELSKYTIEDLVPYNLIMKQ